MVAFRRTTLLWSLLLAPRLCDAFTALPTTNAASSSSRRAAPLQEGSNANERMPMRPGSSVALVTPFDTQGNIDFDALDKLLEWHVECETDNLCILGTTGEAAVMSMSEREQVLKRAVNICKGKLPILVGVGTINPNSVQAMTQQAMDLGCDAGLVVTPYYVKPPQRGLMNHFVTIADMGLPVVVYNVPGRTGVDLLDETMTELAAHENIVGLKDATGKLERLSHLKLLLKESNHEDDLLLYSGDDGTSLDFVLQGGHGCISVTANIAPMQMHRLVRHALDGNEEEARAINDKLAMLHTKLFVEANPIPAKWATARIGKMPNGYCRPPLDELDPKWHSELEGYLEQAGLL